MGMGGAGLVATASRVGTVFYAVRLVLLPTLAFARLVTFERVLQSASRTRGMRAGFLCCACRGSVAIVGQGLGTVAGVVGVVTAVLTGSTAALAAILISDHSLAAALISGALVAASALVPPMRFQESAWKRGDTAPLFADEDESPS